AYFTDTYKELNGVARTANIMKTIALEEDLPFHFFVCSRERVREENLTSLKPLIEFPTPFYEELRMGVPDFKELVEELERGGFTGVHVSTPGPLGLMAFLAGKLLGLRVTFAFHTDIPTYARVYTGDEELEGFLWKAFVLLANSSDRFFVPSEYYRRLFLSKGVEPSRISLFRRGVDTELFSPYKREENFWNDRLGRRVKRVILYVGRVAKEKNLETFFYVAKSFPEETFVVVGDGPYREELERVKPRNVHFVGYLRGEELAKAYASSYVFLFPSETETYAQVVLEAMASGLPVVVSSKGAANEHVEDGLNGFIATRKEDFVNRLSLLLEDEPLRNRMATEALYKAKSLELRKTYTEYMLNIAGIKEVVYEGG
ncbi:MAG: glycosyltransferase family 1 protein, partial [Aquificota bacterium]